MSTKWVGLVRFQRNEQSEWENGIGIGPSPTDLHVIIDSVSRIIRKPWDYKSSVDHVFGYIMQPEGIYIDLAKPIPQKVGFKTLKLD